MTTASEAPTGDTASLAAGARGERGDEQPAWRRWALGTPGCVALAVAIAAVAVWQALAGNSWRPPFFFDEMWRVDFIRAADPVDRMLSHDTPVPVGWVALMHVLTAPLPYRPVVFRAISAVWFLAGLGVLAALFARISQRGVLGPRPREWFGTRRVRIPLLTAPVAVGLVAFLPPVSHYVQWFNNYTFEILIVALLMLAAEELDRWPRAFPALCALIATAPLFVLGGLFVLPGVVACAGVWAWRDDATRRRARMLALAGSLVLAAVAMLAVWVTVYRPVSRKPSISSYWIDYGASLGGANGLRDLLAKSLEQLQMGLIGDKLYFDSGTTWKWLALAVVAVGVVVGLVSVARRWPWLVVAFGSAWVLSIMASAVQHWPMTIERVNLCWQILFFATAAFGVVRAMVWCVPQRHPWIALPALAVLFVGVWFPPYDVGIDVFARNLTYDLQAVGREGAANNLVVQYHELAHFYAHNELINTSQDPRHFSLVYEQVGDKSLYQPIDGVVRSAGLRSGDLVWCVIPWEVGDAGAQACRFADPSSYELVVDRSGAESNIRAYRVR